MEIFKEYAATPNNKHWNNLISREKELYSRNNDLRNDFERDYTRIIHSNAYKRLKHKTQVFFSPENDHICTRIEHVTHVESISYTIAKHLGLNTELTKAISVAHDIGHSPFGHQGEKILSQIMQKDLNTIFWHEKNGLNFVDKLELLEDNNKKLQNLNLTYAVRDGIISHCGEIDENNLKPRNEFINLHDYKYPNQYSPYTWEGCVVKIADKISYLCRDIEDAITLGILDSHIDELFSLLKITSNNECINNTILINNLIQDLCINSSPSKGLSFSPETFELINKIKNFNYKNIYLSERLKPSNRYFKIVINEIYNTLKSYYDKENTFNNLKKLCKTFPKLGSTFLSYISNYYNTNNKNNLKNELLFSIENPHDYYKSIIYYISGMTDNFAIECYNEIINF